MLVVAVVLPQKTEGLVAAADTSCVHIGRSLVRVGDSSLLVVGGYWGTRPYWVVELRRSLRLLIRVVGAVVVVGECSFSRHKIAVDSE